MALNEEFIQLLPVEIEKHHDDLMTLREFLIRYKNSGMDEESMLANVEELRGRSNSEETEGILFLLMDLITGWCNPSLRIF